MLLHHPVPDASASLQGFRYRCISSYSNTLTTILGSERPNKLGRTHPKRLSSARVFKDARYVDSDKMIHGMVISVSFLAVCPSDDLPVRSDEIRKD